MSSSDVKDKTIFIKVQTLDEMDKTYVIKSSSTARDLSNMVSEKLSVHPREHFYLYFAKSDKSSCRCIEPEEQPIRFIVEEIHGKGADLEKYLMKAEWDEVKKAFDARGKFVYKRRLYFPQIKNYSDGYFVQSFYQTVSDVLSGVIPTTEAMAIELGAILMQVSFGDYKKDICQPGFLTGEQQLPKFLPGSMFKGAVSSAELEKSMETWESGLFESYARLPQGISKLESMKNYISKVQNFPFYGANVWKANNMKSEYAESCYLAVTSSALNILKNNPERTLQMFLPYSDMSLWKYKKTSFTNSKGNVVYKDILTIQIGMYTKEELQFQLDVFQGREIVMLLKTYAEVLLEEIKAMDNNKSTA